MRAISAEQLTHRYGRTPALVAVDWQVPEGALYALLGPNGAGKTTLMRIAAGALRPSSGAVIVFGRNVARLNPADRQRLGWVAESQKLPGWMTLSALEAWLAPLYEGWDATLARELRERFELDPARRLSHLSRGQHMKVALLCALAPRPRLLLMDEPFTGMDVVVKDEIVQGLLATCGDGGCTVVISSHDLVELELLADHVGFLADGRLLLSENRDALRTRYLRVEGTLSRNAAIRVEPEWLSVERSGQRFTLVADMGERPGQSDRLLAQLPPCEHVDLRPATLRELFIALAQRRRSGAAATRTEEVPA